MAILPVSTLIAATPPFSLCRLNLPQPHRHDVTRCILCRAHVQEVVAGGLQATSGSAAVGSSRVAGLSEAAGWLLSASPLITTVAPSRFVPPGLPVSPLLLALALTHLRCSRKVKLCVLLCIVSTGGGRTGLAGNKRQRGGGQQQQGGRAKRSSWGGYSEAALGDESPNDYEEDDWIIKEDKKPKRQQQQQRQQQQPGQQQQLTQESKQVGVALHGCVCVGGGGDLGGVEGRQLGERQTKGRGEGGRGGRYSEKALGGESPNDYEEDGWIIKEDKKPKRQPQQQQQRQQQPTQQQLTQESKQVGFARRSAGKGGGGVWGEGIWRGVEGRHLGRLWTGRGQG